MVVVLEGDITQETSGLYYLHNTTSKQYMGAGGRFPQIRTDAQLSATVWLEREGCAIQFEARDLFVLDNRRVEQDRGLPLCLSEVYSLKLLRTAYYLKGLIDPVRLRLMVLCCLQSLS